MPQQRPVPSNLEAERAVLGAALVSDVDAGEILAAIKPSDFFSGKHARIYQAIYDMDAKGDPIDSITVAAELDRRGQLDGVGGRAYLVDLGQFAFASGNVGKHIEIVRTAATMRGLVTAGTKIAAIGYDADLEAPEALDAAERELYSVADGSVDGQFVDLSDLLVENYNNLIEMRNGTRERTGVGTGFSGIDGIFGGLRGGDLVVLAARPSIGKTAFALNMAVRSAMRGTRVCIFSLEMPAVQLAQRIVSMEAGVSSKAIQTNALSDMDLRRIVEANNRMSRLPISVDDSSSSSVSEMRAKARRRLRDCKDEDGLIIVDYLQLMKPRERSGYGSREVEVAEMSRGLKMIAKDLNVPVIALSQLNRSVERREDKTPHLSDLRESGAIEQDADIVMFLDRSKTADEAAGDGRPPFGTANVIVAKHRNGPLGRVSLAFDAETTRFDDIAIV